MFLCVIFFCFFLKQLNVVKHCEMQVVIQHVFPTFSLIFCIHSEYQQIINSWVWLFYFKYCYAVNSLILYEHGTLTAIDCILLDFSCFNVELSVFDFRNSFIFRHLKIFLISLFFLYCYSFYLCYCYLLWFMWFQAYTNYLFKSGLFAFILLIFSFY